MSRIAKRTLAFLLVLCVALLPSCSTVRFTAEDGFLYITFFDVGQGDAILLQTADGAILVDAGTENAEESLLLSMQTLGVLSLSLFVMTHPDADHIGGADGVIDRLPIDEVWCSGSPSDTGATRRMEAALERADLAAKPVTTGERYTLGALQLLVLSPERPTSNTNASSVVLLVSYGETDILLMGDADAKAEAKILEEFPSWEIDCELLKAGHHGSRTSSSTDFLSVATPEYTIISCGAGNSYGHPHGEVLERLSAVGSEVLRTDLEGSIYFYTDGRTLFRGR